MAFMCLILGLLSCAALLGWLGGEWLVDSSSEEIDQSFLSEMEFLLSLDQEREEKKLVLLADSIRFLKSWALRKEALRANALTRQEMRAAWADTQLAQTVEISPVEQALVGCPVGEISDLDITAMVVSISLSPDGELPLSQEEEMELAFWDAGFYPSVLPTL